MSGVTQAGASRYRRIDKEKLKEDKLISDIISGEYVLVLGNEFAYYDGETYIDSDAIILKRLTELCEAEGYLQHKVIQEKDNTQNVDFNYWASKLHDDTYPHVEQAVEYALNENHLSLNPLVIKLLQSRCFRVVMTTSFDPLLEEELCRIWQPTKLNVLSLFGDREDKSFDFNNEKFQDSNNYYDVEPTLYYLFGRCFNDEKFVVSDNDRIEAMVRWFNDSPKKFLNYVKNKKILAIGCKLDDWLFRFFWHLLRSDSTRDGNVALTFNTEERETDRNLFEHLERNKVSIETDPIKFMTNLLEKFNQEEITKMTAARQSGGVFISYASEDFPMAYTIFRKLNSEGIPVWMDVRLKGGDEYNREIDQAINNCSVFVPILSQTVASELTKGASNNIYSSNRYFFREWEKACGVNSPHKIVPVTTYGYDIKADYHQQLSDSVKGIRDERTIFDLHNNPISELIQLLAKR